MTRLVFVVAAAALVVACAAEPPGGPTPEYTATTSPVVYGDDDRVDWYAEPDPDLRALTEESIVALIPERRLEVSDTGEVRITGRPLGEARSLCEGERFADQPAAANCSGTLVGPDLVLTAGHCVRDAEDCAGYRYVFDYLYEADGVLRAIDPVEDVYACAELLIRRESDGIDFAVLRLDREVHASHRPVPIRGGGPLADGTPLTVVGFGSGLPAKIDAGGRVIDPRAEQQDWFAATTDTFGGNSGSGVFDSETLEVVGILVRGERDYEEDVEAGCSRVSVLPDEPERGIAEEIVYASRALEALCAGRPDIALCDAPGGWCRACASDDDCVDGWTCRDATDGSGLAWCAAPCASDDDCRSDHACIDGGSCAPRVIERCAEGDAWRLSTCGLRLALIAACGDADVCTEATCIPAGAGNRCDAPVVVEPTSQRLAGAVDRSYSDDVDGSCGGAGPDRVYAFELSTPRRLVATTTGFDTVLHVRRTCDDAGSELACDDDSTPPGERGSRVDVDLEPGTHFLFVDAYGDNGGEFELDLRFGPLCECDVGQTRCGLGVLERCAETGAECPEWTAITCASGATCVGGRCVQQGRQDTCDDALVVGEGSQRGDLAYRYGNDAIGSCGGEGPDAVFAVDLEGEALVRATLRGADRVYLREACGDPLSEVACAGRGPDGAPAEVEALLPAGRWYVFADTRSEEAAGDFTLRIAIEPTGTEVDVGDAGSDGSGDVDLPDAGDDDGASETVEPRGGGRGGCASAAPQPRWPLGLLTIVGALGIAGRRTYSRRALVASRHLLR